MTPSQTIHRLAVAAGYPSGAAAIKAKLGKTPISLSTPRANRIIASLRDEIREAEEAAARDYEARHPLTDLL